MTQACVSRQGLAEGAVGESIDTYLIPFIASAAKQKALVAFNLRVQGADMRLRDIVNVADCHGERRRGILAKDRSEGEMVRTFVEILGRQGQLVPAEDDGRVNVDGIEVGLLVGDVLFGVLESQHF